MTGTPTTSDAAISGATAGERRPRPKTEYAQVLQAVQAAGLLKRKYTYYAVKVGVTLAALAGVWVAFAFLGNSWAQIALAVPLAVILTQMLFLSHDAAHRQIFHSNEANEIAALVMGTLVGGVSLAWWHNKHNRHHSAPNHIGRDPDIDATVIDFYPSENPPKSRIWRFLRERQGVWFFPLLIVEAVNLHAQSVHSLIVRPKVKRRWIELAMLVVRLCGYPAVVFTVLSPGKAATFLAVQLAVTGLYLGSVFAASHIGMPILAHDARLDFFRRQVLTSRNIRGGRMMSAAMGGLNLQIEHHLFPNAAGSSLRRIRPLVHEFCADNAIEYHDVTIFRAWATVAGYLNRVGLRAPNTFICPMVASLRPH